MHRLFVLVLGVAAVSAVTLTAQSWKPSRLADGQPDIAGYYNMAGMAGSGGLHIENTISVMSGRPSKGVVLDPADGMIPYLPWARVRRDEVNKDLTSPNVAQVDTRNRGWPDGVPRINFYFVNPFQIIQTTDAVVFLYEAQHEFRYVPLDGRPQPDKAIQLWMGSSRGHWEGNTLVVTATNHYDRVRLSVAGDFASKDLKVTERWTWLDRDTIDYKVTFEDPNVFSRPWTAGIPIKRVTEPGFELMEYSGVEGDRDAHLMVDIPASQDEPDGSK